MKPALFAFLLVVATSCFAQQDPSAVCNRDLAADARFASIADKLPLAGISEMTFEMLANEKSPNAKEQKAIADWVSSHKECTKLGEAFRQQNYPPQVIALLIEADNSVVAVAADLFNRKLTYGAANKRMQSNLDDFRNRLAAFVQQIKSQQEAQRQAQDAEKAAQQRDAAARQAAQDQAQQAQQALEAQQAQQRAAQADAARRQILMQMIQNNKPTPIVPYQMPVKPTYNTYCSRIGDQVNCTTQ